VNAKTNKAQMEARVTGEVSLVASIGAGVTLSAFVEGAVCLRSCCFLFSF
jgi:hypothetical protein